MSTDDVAIPQETLDGILARVLASPPDPELKPLFGIDRILCHSSGVVLVGRFVLQDRPDRQIGSSEVPSSVVSMQRTSMDLTYWNGRFFLWCLSRRPPWAMTQDLRIWSKQIRPIAQA